MSDEKHEDKNENVVLAFFDSQEAADEAIDGLKKWDHINDHFKLGDIGTIYKDGDKVKTHMGRKSSKGIAVGATVGVIGAVLTGGLSLIGGVVGGSVLGGGLGSFFKKSLHLTKDEIAQIGAELDSGKVAVVVNCDEDEIDPSSQYLSASGGTVRAYKVPGEALEEVATALDEAGEMPSEDDAKEQSA